MRMLTAKVLPQAPRPLMGNLLEKKSLIPKHSSGKEISTFRCLYKQQAFQIVKTKLDIYSSWNELT